VSLFVIVVAWLLFDLLVDIRRDIDVGVPAGRKRIFSPFFDFLVDIFFYEGRIYDTICIRSTVNVGAPAGR
jgi:hypothetical protein